MPTFNLRQNEVIDQPLSTIRQTSAARQVWTIINRKKRSILKMVSIFPVNNRSKMPADGVSGTEPELLQNEKGRVVRVASIEIHKEEFSFSAGHFTIFSAEDRENMHGHNYYVSIAFHFRLQAKGLSFDYRHYKKKLLSLCNQLDRYFLLPGKSPFLTIEDNGDYWIAHFNNKKLPFLKEDVIILPISNITIEELSHWFLQKILEDKQTLGDHSIVEITVKVYNGPGQSAGAHWSAHA